MYFVARTGTGGWSPGYNLITQAIIPDSRGLVNEPNVF